MPPVRGKGRLAGSPSAAGPLRIGPHEGLVPFLGREGFYVSPNHVVIKVAPLDLNGRARFTHEARLLAEIVGSRSVLEILELGMDGDREYYALQAPGPLAALDARLIGTDRAMPLVGNLARALSELHDVGIAYRDLRPITVALASLDEPLLYDFFCAGRLGAGRSVQTVRWLRGPTVYDAPETHDEEYDGVRADIFSLGVLGRELCGPHATPSPGVVSLLARMTEREPGRRPACLAEVIETLERRGGTPPTVLPSP